MAPTKTIQSTPPTYLMYGPLITKSSALLLPILLLLLLPTLTVLAIDTIKLNNMINVFLINVNNYYNQWENQIHIHLILFFHVINCKIF